MLKRLVAASALILAAAVSIEAIPPPHAQLECGFCHLRTRDGATRAADSGPLIEESQLCLSCHDGRTSAPEVNLHRSHPVGIAWDSERDDRSLRDPRSAQSHLGGTIAEDLLRHGHVECLSCHDPHGERDGLLVMANDRSQLCITCHDI